MNANDIRTAVESRPLASQPFYTRVAALGFALIALTGIVSLAIALISNSVGDAWDFTLALVVIGLLVAAALLRFGAWAQVLAAALSFLVLATVVPFSTYIMVHPEDGTDFVPLMFLLFGAVLGFAGSVAGLIQRRRHTLRPTATHAESLGLKAILAALGIVIVASLVLTLAARTPVSADAKAGSVDVEMKNFKFSPDQLRVKAGSTVRIIVKNGDTTLHTFTLNEAGVDVSVPAGAERLIEFQAPAAGTYQWYCAPDSTGGPNGRTGMVGTLVVY